MGEEIAKVVGDVKQAILEANLYGPGSKDLVVRSVTLILNVVETASGGVDATFEVPFINKEVGVNASANWTSTNTITIDLVPPARVGVSQGLQGRRTVKADLANAIAVIRDTVLVAQSSQPSFNLDSAEVDLEFGLDRDGSLKLVVTGEYNKQTTQGLKLKLGPPVAE